MNTNVKPSLNTLYDMQTKNSDEIIGRWEAVQTTEGGLGSILEFSRDGSLNVSFGPLLHGTYKLESGRLIEKIFQPDGSQTTEYREVDIQDDTLIMGADDIAKDHKIRLVRLTPRDQDSSHIVGRWGQKAPIQFYEFKADGSLVISGDLSNIPFNLTDATYKVDNHHLSISGIVSNTKERVERSYEISFEGDTLIQKDSNGLENRMRRVSQNNPDKSSIVGKWEVDFTAHRSFLESTILEYTKSGEFTFRMSLSSSKGRYSLSGDLLTTILETGAKISKLRFENGFLLLQSPTGEGPEDKFKRSY